MRMQSARVLDHTAPEQPFPYTAVVEYSIGWNRPKHVICAGSSEGLRGAFEAVNAGVEGTPGYMERDGFIEEVIVRGPSGQIRKLEALTIGLFYDIGVQPSAVSDAIRSLEMH